MPLIYTTGALNPASSTRAHDIRRSWKAGFDAAIAGGNTNWSVLEHDIITGGVERTVVVNSLGFVIVITSATDTNNNIVNVYIGESYNTTTKVINKLGVNYAGGPFSGSPVTVNADGTFPGGINPTGTPTGGYFLPGTPGGAIFVTATTAQNEFTAHIDNDYAILSFRTGTGIKGQWVYLGRYKSMIDNPSITHDKRFIALSNTTVNSAVIQTAGNGGQSVNATGLWPGCVTWSEPNSGHPGNALYIDKYSATVAANFSPLYISRASNFITGLPSHSGAQVHGWLTGELKDIYHAGATVANYGDTVIYDGSTYKYIGGLNPLIDGFSQTSIAGWARIN
jgi:hypothetical protein